jgi:hypothetical protein
MKIDLLKDFYFRIFFLFHGLIVFSFIGKSQDNVLNKTFSISCDKCNYAEILKKVTQQIAVPFAFNSDIFNDTKQFSVNFSDKTISYLFDSVFSDSLWKYSFIDNYIVIYKKSTSFGDINSVINDETKEKIIIEGKILDRTTDKPVPFATIFIDGYGIGTSANYDGNFILKIRKDDGYRKIGISCIGYKTIYKELNEAVNEKIFYLETDYIPIQEVIIRKTDPLYIIINALKKINQNYPTKPFILTSFYRESIKKGDNLKSVNEAVVQTYKSGYLHYGNEQIKIIKGRKTDNFSPNDSILMKMKGGLNSILLLDIVKNKPDFLAEDFIKYYDFKLLDILPNDNRELYIIGFEQKKEIKPSLYTGKIYIDIEKLAIEGVEFSLNKKNIEDEWDRFVLKKPPYLKVRPVEANYQVNYRQINGRYYPNQIITDVKFKIKMKNHFFSSLYAIKIENAVIDIDTIDVKQFKIKEIADIKGLITDNFILKPEIYWNDYNYIKPDDILEEAIQKILNSQQK